jgi:radical SAM superfamily enzyme YgiQ (UPF0313 family)
MRLKASKSNMSEETLSPKSIILCTLNAKFIHASLGLRYLLANMAKHGNTELAKCTQLLEYTINREIKEIASDLLSHLNRESVNRVQIIGFGVYIWNVKETTELIHLIKRQSPRTIIVLGGPEVSHEVESQEIVQISDYVIKGWGDVSFPKLCRDLIDGPKPIMKIIQGVQPELHEIELPYQEFSDQDLAHRVLYVEASRGCPFKCEFCLSSLDKTAWAFDTSRFLAELSTLYFRGARNFKFVDRTFNLKIEASIQILNFFLDRIKQDGAEGLLVHFEVIPDNLPDRLKAVIAQFPKGTLQFEIGIQSFNEQVQELISRRQDNEKTEANLRWLLAHSNAHLHTDLIFGLPGENIESFAKGFDRLLSIGPQEIQLGVLKRLRGTPLSRHEQNFSMVFDLDPPYTIKATKDLDSSTIDCFVRFAKYWDLIANSGRFKAILSVILASNTLRRSAFWSFFDISGFLWEKTGKTFGLTPETLVDLIFEYLTQRKGMDAEKVRKTLLADYLGSGARMRPKSLAMEDLPLSGNRHLPSHSKISKPNHLKARQVRHH